MSVHRVLHHRSRPRWTVRTEDPKNALNAAAETVRTVFMLALVALGLIHAIATLGAPWSSLITTLLLVLLARVFFVVAQHSTNRRFAWLLSASIAAGLGIADFYNVVDTVRTSPDAVVITFIAFLLLVVRPRTRQAPSCRSRRSYKGPSEATHGLLVQHPTQAPLTPPDPRNAQPARQDASSRT
jgi:hypothetical protein